MAILVIFGKNGPKMPDYVPFFGGGNIGRHFRPKMAKNESFLAIFVKIAKFWLF